jgi:hypothetical protein
MEHVELGACGRTPWRLQLDASGGLIMVMGTMRARWMALACIAGYTQMHHALGAQAANLPKTVSTLGARTEQRVVTAVARIPLRLAVAADRTVNDGSHWVVIDGLATTLRKRILAKRGIDAMVGAGRADDEPMLPIVEADQRTNSIIVRDRVEDLAADVGLAKALDVKRETLQIDVHAIDIDRASFARIVKDWAGAHAEAEPSSSDTHWHSAILDDRGQALLARLATEDNARPVIEQALTAINRSSASIERSRYTREAPSQQPGETWSVQTWRLTIRPVVVAERGVAHVGLSVVGRADERAQATLADGQALALWFGLDLDDPALARIRLFVLAPRTEHDDATNQANDASLKSDGGEGAKSSKQYAVIGEP